jgi:hypothetical protein
MYVLQFYAETDSVTSKNFFLHTHPPPFPFKSLNILGVEKNSLANLLHEQPNSFQFGVKLCRAIGEKKKNWKRPQFFTDVFSAPPSPPSLYSTYRQDVNIEK